MFLLGWRLLYTRVQKTRKALLQGLGEQNANAEFLDFLMIMKKSKRFKQFKTLFKGAKILNTYQHW